jgi:PAS domain S-box-containing protein
VRLVGSVIDLTPQKRAEESARHHPQGMQQALARSQAIFRQMTEGLVIFDAEGNLLDMNPAALAVYGFESVESLPRHLHGLGDILEVRDMAGRPVETQEWPAARALRGETFTGFEVRVRRRDTGRNWIGSYGGAPVLGPDGELDVAIVTLRDITAQKEAEAALAQAKARIEVALTATEVGIWHWDVRHDRVLADANLLRLYGLGEEERELPLEQFLACVHPDDRGRVKSSIDVAASCAGAYQAEYRVMHPDGEVRWIHARGRAEADDRGIAVTFPGVAVDVTERKRAEEALQRTEGLLSAITGETEDMIAAEDGEFRYLFFNEAYECEFRRLWGRDITVGTSMIEALAPWPEDQQKARELWSRALAGERFTVTVEFGAPERGREVYDLHFNPIHDDRGRPIGAAHILRNVTERTRTQQALRESEQFLRRVLDQLFAFVGVLDLDGTVREANRAPLEAAGISAADVLGRKFWDCYWWSYSPEVQQRLRDAVERARRGELVRFDVEVRVRAGQRMWIDFQMAPMRDADNRITHLIPSGIDITARRRAEEDLRQSEGFHRQTLESIPGMVFTTRPDGWCDYQSQQWADYTGIPASEHVGDGWNALLHPDDRARAYAAWRAAVGKHAPYDLEYRVARRDGAYEWFRVIGQPIHDAGGRIVRWFGVAMNIQRLKAAEEALRDADRRKDQFIATLAHELRNPLAPIRTGLDLLNHLGDDKAAVGQVLPMMGRQLTHLLRLVDDLLDVSRVTRDKIGLHKEHLDLAKVIESALEMSETGITRGERRLMVDLPSEPLLVEGDRIRLVQVLANLLNNAAKFTAENGHIWVRAERRGEQVQVSVRDDGIGIPSERLGEVFEMFSQVQDGRGGGLGIGLTLVRRLVEMHGGSVSARSDGPGRGAEFIVTLPLKTEGPTAGAAPGDHTLDAVARRILVVDDNGGAPHNLR